MTPAKKMTRAKNMTHMTAKRKMKLTRNIQWRYMANCWLALLIPPMPPARRVGLCQQWMRRWKKDAWRCFSVDSRRYCTCCWPSSSRFVIITSFLLLVVCGSKDDSLVLQRRRTRSPQDMAPQSAWLRTWENQNRDECQKKEIQRRTKNQLHYCYSLTNTACALAPLGSSPMDGSCCICGPSSSDLSLWDMMISLWLWM